MATPNDIVPLATLLARLPDNNSGDISAEDMRDVVSDLYASIVTALEKKTEAIPLSGVQPELITTIPASASRVHIDIDNAFITGWTPVGQIGAFFGLQVGGSSSYLTGNEDYVGASWGSSTYLATTINNANRLRGTIELIRVGTTNKWFIYGGIGSAAADNTGAFTPSFSDGYVDLGVQSLSRIRLNTVAAQGSPSYTGGSAEVTWE